MSRMRRVGKFLSSDGLSEVFRDRKQSAQGESLSTPSTLNLSESASSDGSWTNPEVEGPCEISFTVKISTYGRYKKVEHEVARHLAIALQRTFGADGWELRDELGRIVLFDVKASFGSTEQIHYVEKPS